MVRRGAKRAGGSTPTGRHVRIGVKFVLVLVALMPSLVAVGWVGVAAQQRATASSRGPVRPQRAGGPRHRGSGPGGGRGRTPGPGNACLRWTRRNWLSSERSCSTSWCPRQASHVAALNAKAAERRRSPDDRTGRSGLAGVDRSLGAAHVSNGRARVRFHRVRTTDSQNRLDAAVLSVKRVDHGTSGGTDQRSTLLDRCPAPGLVRHTAEHHPDRRCGDAGRGRERRAADQECGATRAQLLTLRRRDRRRATSTSGSTHEAQTS